MGGFRCRRRLERVDGIEPTSSAWKAAALPLCYTRRGVTRLKPWPGWLAESKPAKAGGGSRTRTYEGVRQRIYSPPPLPLGTFPLARRAALGLGTKASAAGRIGC